METLAAIRARRSVKKYDPEHRLSDAELRTLLEHLALTPSSFNMQNWHFVVATDREVQAELCAAAWNQKQVRDCSATFVLCGDLKAHLRYDRYLREAPANVQEMMRGFVEGLYAGKDDLLRDEACRSIGLAGMNLMLAAKDLGYDSCPMIGFDPCAGQRRAGLARALPAAADGHRRQGTGARAPAHGHPRPRRVGQHRPLRQPCHRRCGRGRGLDVASRHVVHLKEGV